jgi:colanic acid/amylovoran biosynthesis glycosyltransferase
VINIAYITSAKKGLAAFTFKELELLEKNDINFILCLPQLKEGPFLPKKNWKYFVPEKISILIDLFVFIFSHPIKLIKYSLDSIKKSIFPCFVLSIFFLNKLDKFKISSIHCQMGGSKLYIGYYLSKLMKKKLTVTIHAYELYNYDSSKKDFISKVLNYCSSVITISKFNKNEIVKKFDVPGEKVKIMYLYPANFDKSPEKKKILIVANWVKQKGYGFFLEAISNLKRDDFIVWAVGGYVDDINAVRVDELVKKFNLEEKIILFGFQPGKFVNILYKYCDIFCLPSVTVFDNEGKITDREGIPVSLMEAMVWEKPVISTFHAGIPELVDEVLVPERNIEKLEIAIEFLLDNPQLCKIMGKRNKEIIEKKFNTENINTLVQLFSKIKQNSGNDV